MERQCGRGEAQGVYLEAMEKGATGAVTSWGSGVDHRETIRIFWEQNAKGGSQAPEDAEDLEEEDWSGYWKNSLTAFPAGKRFVLVPAWEKPPEGTSAEPIYIDPGMAFGAGDHPTTRLCIEILESLAQSEPGTGPVLDVGAGTGVLSLAAAKIGLGPVDALDIDPFCHASCRRNIKRNGLTGLVKPLLLSLDLLKGAYPLVIANIAPRQIESMALTMASKVKLNGKLILSGFGGSDEDRVMRSLGAQFKTTMRREEGGWLALLAERFTT